jgi:hypothetical protein
LVLGVDLRQFLQDAAVLALLLAALGLVFLLRKHGAGPEKTNAAGQPGVQDAAGEPSTASPLRLAVTPPEFDDMGQLLDTLGTGYRYTEIAYDDLLDPEKLESYDVVFLTCSGAPPVWLGRRLGRGDRGSPGVFQLKATIEEQLNKSLRQYVRQGGTLYASDWQFEMVKVAFPEFIDDSRNRRGAAQKIRAEVVDPVLQRRLGTSLELRFDKPAWRPAAFQGPELNVYLRGSYELSDGSRASGPLLVAFAFGGGTVIFTSFHNEAQNSQTELALLRHLVFTTVTARLDTKIRRTLVEGGFSPVERNLLSASTSAQAITQTYESRAVRDLQFVLGFENRGAQLRLTVTGPDGRQISKTGAATIRIDLPQAAPGAWRYSITPLVVPYANFPFTMTVGEK